MSIDAFIQQPVEGLGPRVRTVRQTSGNYEVDQPVVVLGSKNGLDIAEIPALGQAAAAGSLPVVLATDQSALPIELAADQTALPVELNSSVLSAFGTLEVAELSPLIQVDFVYGLNSQVWNPTVASGTGASVDTNDNLLRVQCGTAASGYAYVTSRKIVLYRSGQGNVARFTTVFSEGVVDNEQLIGVANLASPSVNDGYLVGTSHTGEFGFFHVVAGVENFYPKTEWNGDRFDGSEGSSFDMDITKGNVWMIKYPYLGFGTITLYALTPGGKWVVGHTIEYPNSTNAVQLSNPSMQLVAFSKNMGNTINRICYSGSMSVFVSGERSYVSKARWATDSTFSSVSTETGVIVLKNATTYNGKLNRGLVRLHCISLGTNSNVSYGFVRIKINASNGAALTFNAVNGSTADGGNTITNGNSVVSVATNGTTVSNGLFVWNRAFGTSSTNELDLTPYDIFLIPGDTMTISVSASAGTSGSLAVNWVEDV